VPVLHNIARLATCGGGEPAGELRTIERAALAWRDGVITWLGRERELPAELASEERLDAASTLVVPGLVDCHTHLAFGGYRFDEHSERIGGKSYLEIARAGGGIRRTVRETRAASEEELLEKARGYLQAMWQSGVTAVEAKSGYGLSLADEKKQLRVYARLATEEPVRIVPTLLAAHVVPPEFVEDRAGYVRAIVEEIIPDVAAEGLARFCDVFLEEGAFSRDESRQVLEAGKRHGLRAKLHADQLTDGGGALLAAEVGAASADHLEHASQEGIEAMARAGVVAVSLPVATLYLGQPPLQARRFLDAGVSLAVATDFNPGSAPCCSLQLAMLLACLLQRMTPSQALAGATLHAARAIGLEREIGSLEVGKRADFVLVDAPSVEHWVLETGVNRIESTFIGGERVWSAE
jgi:imidazolonepropionase